MATLRRRVAADVPLAPVHAAVQARLVAIAPGHAEARMPVPDAVGDLDAALWLLADFVSGVAVTATLGPGERITTLRLTLHAHGRDVSGGTLHATGRLDDRLPQVAVSTAVVRDDVGRTIARATGRNAVLGDDVDATAAGAPTAGWADPPRSIGRLVVDGQAPDPASVNSAGVVQGGVLASVGARALAGVLDGPPDEVSATFLRAVAPDGRTVHADAVLEHGGRRLRSGRADLRDDRGRLVLTVTGLRYAGA